MLGSFHTKIIISLEIKRKRILLHTKDFSVIKVCACVLPPSAARLAGERENTKGQNQLLNKNVETKGALNAKTCRVTSSNLLHQNQNTFLLRKKCT